MRAPYDLLLANPDLDIPFCLNWANEPWTVQFDGLSTKSGVLLEQRHSAEDDLAFFRDIEPALHDRRYITVNGRPLLVIYRPSLFPEIGATLDRWRDCFLRSGLKEPYMAMMQTNLKALSIHANLVSMPPFSFRRKILHCRTLPIVLNFMILAQKLTPTITITPSMRLFSCPRRTIRFSVVYSPSGTVRRAAPTQVFS